MKSFFRLLYVGTILARLHIVSYLTSIINGVLWLVLVLVPSIVLTGRTVEALLTFLPGVFALIAASSGMWTATEFLRFYVYQGLTDMFRECGLTVFHYLVCGIHIDVLLIGLATYLLASTVSCLYLGVDLSILVPGDPIAIAIAFVTAIASYMLCGSLIAYLYTVTRIGGVWTNLIQMLLVIGTIIPPSVLPSPWIALINPATIVAELLRASYGTNILPKNTLFILSLPLTAIYIVLSYVVSKACERRIARYGVEYRY